MTFDLADGVVGVLGGTGAQGRGLGRRLGLAGVKILLGSRDVARAEQAATMMQAAEPQIDVVGVANAVAAATADVVVVSVPWRGHRELLGSLAGLLQGKLVVDCVNPIRVDADGPRAVQVEEGSAAQQAAAVLPGSTVVAAFHHVSAVLLLDPLVERIDTDVLVLGDDRSATDAVAAMAELIPGVRGIYAGRLRDAGQVEALSANLIAVNRRYKGHAGLRVTDVPH